MRLSNLTANTKDVRLRVPAGYRAASRPGSGHEIGADHTGSKSAGLPVRLAPFGFEEIHLRRVPGEDADISDL